MHPSGPSSCEATYHLNARAAAGRGLPKPEPPDAGLSRWHHGGMTSQWSIASRNSYLAIASEGSVLSVGSIGSACSIGSVGSFGSLLSIGSSMSLGSAFSWQSLGSAFSAQSNASLLSAQASCAVRSEGEHGSLPRYRVPALVGAGLVACAAGYAALTRDRWLSR